MDGFTATARAFTRPAARDDGRPTRAAQMRQRKCAVASASQRGRYALFACTAGFWSRSSRRRILPTFDFGSSSRNSMNFGFL